MGVEFSVGKLPDIAPWSRSEAKQFMEENVKEGIEAALGKENAAQITVVNIDIDDDGNVIGEVNGDNGAIKKFLTWWGENRPRPSQASG